MAVDIYCIFTNGAPIAITVSILHVYLDLEEYHSLVKTETMHKIAEALVRR
mgnify:CR=1 FL=1